MAITTNTVVCAKCERKIDLAFADFDEITTHTDAFLTANGIMFERE